MNLFKLFKNNSCYKRIISFIMVTALVLPFIPNYIVFANKQANVDYFHVVQTGAGNSYEVSFNYSYKTSTSEDTTPNINNPSAQDIGNLSVYLRNVSSSITSNSTLLGTYELPVVTSTTNYTQPYNLESDVEDGHLYSVTSEAWHTHTQTTSPGVNINVNAQTEGSVPEEYLYLTDLIVDGSGVGNSLTVNWDAPTYNGQTVFTGYAIYYTLMTGGDVTPESMMKDADHFFVFDADAEVIVDPTRPGVRRLSYTYDVPNGLMSGASYAIVVEPFFTHSDSIGDVVVGNQIRTNTDGTLKTSATVTLDNSDTRQMSYKQKYYWTDEAVVVLPLYAMADDSTYIRLQWDTIHSFLLDQIYSIEIWSGTTSPFNQNSWIKQATLFEDDATLLTHWRLPVPTVKTYYILRISLLDGTTTDYIFSTMAEYDPNDINLKPNRPLVEATDKIEIGWSSFYRHNYESLTDPEEMIVDKDIFYDVYITDQLSNFIDGVPVSTLPPVLDNIHASTLTERNLALNGDPGYYELFETYWHLDSSGTFQEYAISGNKLYYIVVIAKSPIYDNEGVVVSTIDSEPGFLSYFVPSDDDLGAPPALAKPPLQIKKDENGEPMIDHDSITVEWKQSWYEVYDSSTHTWHTNVARVNGELVYGDDIPSGATNIEFYYLTSVDAVVDAFDGRINPEDVRKVDMGDAFYQGKLVPYRDLESEMASMGTDEFTAYLESMANDWEAAGWNELDDPNPTPDSNGFMSYTFNNGDKWTVEENTPYVIFIRGYRTLSDGRALGYPAFTLGTTIPQIPDVDIDPTIPILYEDSHTSTAFTVWWLNQPSLGFELVYSEIFLDDPSGGTLVPAETIAEFAYIEDRVNASGNTVSAMLYEVDDLFPGLSYYVWLRSTSGEKVSDWSNPVFITLDTYTAPNPPDGLGYIGTDHLTVVNTENGLAYEKKDYDYLFLEWLKDPGDKTYYDAAGQLGEGDVESFISPNINNSYNAKFNGLDHLKNYYIRAKTILTITKNEEATEGNVSSLNFNYSYTVEISKYSDFTDSMTITVPPLEPDVLDPADKYCIRLESDWSTILVLRTSGSDEDYDTDVNPDMVPLPESNFDITYDQNSDTLTFTFRSDGVNSDGDPDNSVDQRLITSLINSKAYTLGIDLTNYDDENVLNRKVVLPYNIFTAFEEMKITLEVTAHNLLLSLPPGAFNTAEVKALQDFGRGSMVTLSLSEFAPTMPALLYDQNFASKPHHIEVGVTSGTSNLKLDSLAVPATFDMKVSNRYLLEDTNVGAYYANNNTPDWTRMDANYASESGNVKLQVSKLNTAYGVMSIDAPFVSSDDNKVVTDVMVVSSVLHIPDIGVIDPNDTVHAAQFNNVIAALVKGSYSVMINDAMTDSDFQSLGKSGMLVSGTQVSRESAIHTLIRLYELKNKSSIKDYGSPANSYFSDIDSVSNAYKTSVLKAEYLGFLDDTDYIRASEYLTYQDLFSMLTIIINDTSI